MGSCTSAKKSSEDKVANGVSQPKYNNSKPVRNAHSKSTQSIIQ